MCIDQRDVAEFAAWFNVHFCEWLTLFVFVVAVELLWGGPVSIRCCDACTGAVYGILAPFAII